MDEEIVTELTTTMQQDPHTHAMWIAGSVAEGFNDKLSDIDLWIDIDDDSEKAVYRRIEKFLKARSTLDINFDIQLSHPLISHKIYHLANMNPYHSIEVNLQAHSRAFEFIDGVHVIKVLFDKDSTIKKVPLDKVTLAKELKERKHFLIEKIDIGALSLEKEITRRHFLEALHNYQFWLVEPVVELARIKYAPLKISFGLKHGSRDLPEDIITEIEDLYKIQSIEDLRTKLKDIKKLVKRLDATL